MNGWNDLKSTMYLTGALGIIVFLMWKDFFKKKKEESPPPPMPVFYRPTRFSAPKFRHLCSIHISRLKPKEIAVLSKDRCEECTKEFLEKRGV